ncbi:hypothetical protein DOK78_002144 [Enterococcus sp. DIV2402]|uniref:Uncharacterized protein n=1 Tax=Candidatus Enterococcus lowellii TaxID=2230877 RepID=A0ABZ2SNZ9_9ENTE|nr:hypothetical protein [Enterococcus sp. DIV2402]MBO0463730.1 hypothetical protein [Enterococcus sp. DIV2402]
MNAIVEMTDMLGLDYYYVVIRFKGNKMFLNKPDGICGKYVDKEIILSEIEDIRIIAQNNIEKITFSHCSINYTFVDYNNNVLSYLKKHLYPVLKTRTMYEHLF